MKRMNCGTSAGFFLNVLAASGRPKSKETNMLNTAEWILFGIAIFLIAGLMYMFPVCRFLAKKRLGIRDPEPETPEKS